MTHSDHIGRKAAENVCHAFDYAKHIEQPLNHYITINIRDAPDEPAKIFQKIRHKFRVWRMYALRRLGADARAPAYVYTLEAPNQDHPHANWVVHVPEELATEFRRKLDQWVAKTCGEVGSFDVHVQVVDPESDKTLAKYVVKGTDPAYIGYLHLEDIAEPQGRIWGRRVGVSPSISRAARRQAGFVPRRDRHKWRRSAPK